MLEVSFLLKVENVENIFYLCFPIDFSTSANLLSKASSTVNPKTES
jgi:hypothetical protein